MKAIAAILAFVTLGLGVTASDGRAASARQPAGDTRPNIVFILTDDQRWDSLQMDGKRVMPIVDSVLGAKGMMLRNYFLSIGLCCPSRTSIMRGQYAHSTSVYSNVGDHGGFPAFVNHGDDLSNIATWLDGAGYETALIGKFLNDYRSAEASIVPPGWDRWNALTETAYTDFSESVDGVEVEFPAPLYQTDVLRDQALDFIDDVANDPNDPTKPLFLYWAPHAPHGPATPAKEDRDKCGWLKDSFPPSFNEADVSDKPVSMQKPLMTEDQIKATQAFRVKQCKSLQAVDRAVGAIVEKLEAVGRLSNTLIVFSSDNGMMYGEHRIFMKKNVGYEEAIRAPFIARWDGVIPAGTKDDRLAVNIDIAPTFADAAGVTPDYQVDGTSLMPILRGSYSGDWRHALLLEHSGDDDIAPAFCGVRTDAGSSQDGVVLDRPYVYIWYVYTGEQELYDLNPITVGPAKDPYADPFELNNLASNPAFAEVVTALHAWVETNCVPKPPGDKPIEGAGD